MTQYCKRYSYWCWVIAVRRIRSA